MPTFYTRRGRLTAYALACGYVERKDRGGTVTKLWSEPRTGSGRVYHVRAHDYDSRKRLFWEAYPTLTQARASYDVVR